MVAKPLSYGESNQMLRLTTLVLTTSQNGLQVCKSSVNEEKYWS